MLAISTISIKLCLRIERELLMENKTDEKRMQTITKMLNGEQELSFFEEKEKESKDLKKKKRKLKAITQFHLKKRREFLKAQIVKKANYRKRLRAETLLNEIDLELLQKAIQEVEMC